MPENARAEAFLAKAKDADKQAEQAKDPSVKHAWRAIADGYRDLARVNRHRI